MFRWGRKPILRLKGIHEDFYWLCFYCHRSNSLDTGHSIQSCVLKPTIPNRVHCAMGGDIHGEKRLQKNGYREYKFWIKCHHRKPKKRNYSNKSVYSVGGVTKSTNAFCDREDFFNHHGYTFQWIYTLLTIPVRMVRRIPPTEEVPLNIMKNFYLWKAGVSKA